jgi:hypothetical protein
MTAFHKVLVLGGAALGLVSAAPARAESVNVSPDTTVVSPEEMNRTVAVRDVRMAGDAVTGTVVNNSGKPVRDVQLLIKYVWLWRNERNPGSDSPGRAAFQTIPGELAPGQSREFTYRPDEPLPERRDGHFSPDVQVAGVVEITPAGEARPGSLGAMR